ncbi:GNAT family N-acetyltransferase [Legionella sp. 27cVA30]|uniref:GNAT family N-acetyltransferase n=1 Tax=Legionella sp. 27cVA30 TaxID=2905657 RepID=UPI00209D2F85|nr:GNAT family N-acetyltransferase [Legionella sp. 27cVA30]MCP0914807.1 GNAT family N-acetyltransferase [Legionella sp. 27cVA30]
MNSKILNYLRETYFPIEPQQKNIALRRFMISDTQLLYQWRNHLSVREQSLDNKIIAFPEHQLWCEKKVNDANCVFLMASHAGQLIGTVRYDVDNTKAMVNIYLAPQAQGKGYGKQILLESIRYMQTLNNTDKLLAQIKETNLASVKMFESCGFIKQTN